MRVPITSEKRIKIVIGRSGENNVLSVEFDLTPWVEEYGTGQPFMHIRRHGDEMPYPVALEFSNNIATWLISNTDTAKTGYGKAQLVYMVDEKIKKTKVFRIYVDKSVCDVNYVPDPYEEYLDEFTALVGKMISTYNEYETLTETKPEEYINLTNEKYQAYLALTEDKEAFYNLLTSTKESDYRTLADGKYADYEALATGKESDYRTLASTKEANYNTLATAKETAYTNLASDKESDYRNLASGKEQDYRDLTAAGEAAITDLIEHGISVTDDGEGHVVIHIGGDQ